MRRLIACFALVVGMGCAATLPPPQPAPQRVRIPVDVPPDAEICVDYWFRSFDAKTQCLTVDELRAWLRTWQQATLRK